MSHKLTKQIFFLPENVSNSILNKYVVTASQFYDICIELVTAWHLFECIKLTIDILLDFGLSVNNARFSRG